MKELMSTHLSKRGSVYYFRRKTPLDLIHTFGKESVKSLGTKDRREAEVLVRKLGVQYDQLFAQARNEAVGDDKNTTPNHVLKHESLKLSSYVNGLGINDAHIYAARYQSFLRALREKKISEGKIESFQKFIEWMVDDFSQYVRDGEHPIDDNPIPLWQAAARLQAVNALMDNVELPYQEATSESIPNNQSKKRDSSPLLLELVNKWAGERIPAENTIDKMQRIITKFNEIVGIKQVAKITKLDVVSFKDGLLQSGSTPANANQYLSNLSTLLNFAVNQALIDSNPAVGMKIIIKQSAKDSIQPFDLAALKSIFSSPVYAQSARPKGGGEEAAYWLPLLALFTGARVGELCQLRAEDIREDSYLDDKSNEVRVWLLHVTDEGKGQKVKNIGSHRRIPLHRELIRLGFVDYVCSIKADRVFPELTPAKAYGSLSANWSKWFGRYLRDTIKVTDERMVFHSFRHCFKDYARQASISTEVHNALTGHSGGDVSSIYGATNYPLRPLAEAVEKYKVVGLSLEGI